MATHDALPDHAFPMGVDGPLAVGNAPQSELRATIPGSESDPDARRSRAPNRLPISRRRLGEILLADGAVGEAALEDALRAQRHSGGFLGHWLIERAGVPSRVVADALAPVLEVAYADLVEFPPEPSAVALVPASLCRSARLIPWRVGADRLDVAMVDPLLVGAIDQVRQTAGIAVRPWLTFPGEWERACQERLGSGLDASDLPSNPIAPGVERTVLDARDLSPAARWVDSWLGSAISARASDIHWEPVAERLRVRLRIDGALVEWAELPRDRAGAVIVRLKVMAGMDIAEDRRPQEGRFRFSGGIRPVDLRLSSIPTLWGEKIVARIHDPESAPMDWGPLGMDSETSRRLDALVHRPHGMVLVAGPTGSGKSTTLTAALHRLNDPVRNIVTLEDPIEHPLPGINQVQVQPRIGLTFATGLRALLRQDPDVLLVGEIRDPETASLAVQAATTGHLVLSTVHAESAVAVVGRLGHLGCERWLAAQALVGLVGQRLLAQVCDDCAVEEIVPPDVAERAALGPGVHRVRRGTGCRRCHARGVRGRMGIFETLVVDERFRDAVVAGGSERELREQAFAGGMRPLADAARDVLLRGLVPWAVAAPLLHEAVA